MKFEEFVGQVRHRALLSSRPEAERAIQATLETLAERLAGGEPNHLAAQLPRRIAQYLQHPWSGMGERFSLDEFFERVSEREEVEQPQAAYHARVVIEVLQEAVTKGEIDDVLAQLPGDYRPLFVAGRKDRMTPSS